MTAARIAFGARFALERKKIHPCSVPRIRMTGARFAYGARFALERKKFTHAVCLGSE